MLAHLVPSNTPTATPNPASAGSTVTFTLTVEDPEGLGNLELDMQILRPSVSPVPTPNLPNIPENAAEVDLTLLFQLNQAAPADDYTFELIAIDSDGNESEPAEIDLTIQ